MTARAPYSGPRRNLVIAIDFGTTFSGVSYAVLEPGLIPEIRSVHGFKGQEDQASSTKVPSIIYYDRQGNPRARGAETSDPELAFKAVEEDWSVVDWFKLLLRPPEQVLINAPMTMLPRDKTVDDVLGDYFEYLNQAIQGHIETKHVQGNELWREVKNDSIYVLSHPNGWDGSQQTHMRRAAILGGLIPDTAEGGSRIRFVSEGEASFHWCVESGLASRTLSTGSNVIIADAGGGTLDVSSFRVTDQTPLRIVETKPAECRLAGSIFVTGAFRNSVEAKLRSTAYSDDATISRLVMEFDRKTKRLFHDSSRSAFIPFGAPRDHHPEYGIRSGQLVVQGTEVATYFERSCEELADAIRRQVDPGSFTTVFIVGGFAASPWLFSEVRRRLSDLNIEVCRAESHNAKAVAEGAVGFFLDHYVTARVAKFTYGVYSSFRFEAENPDHQARKHKVHTTYSGQRCVYGGFNPLLLKGVAVTEATVHRIKLVRELLSPSPYKLRDTLICYRGNIRNIEWVDQDPDQFRKLCSVEATVPERSLERRMGSNGGLEFWKCAFAVVLTFGTTEFTCHVEWKEGGETQRGPATVVWEDD